MNRPAIESHWNADFSNNHPEVYSTSGLLIVKQMGLRPKKVNENGKHSAQTLANTRLIAALPEMTTALERCILNFEMNRTGGYNGEGKQPEKGSSYELAKNALLKAGWTE